jgi:thiamine-phosphate diphosphorylase
MSNLSESNDPSGPLAGHTMKFGTGTKLHVPWLMLVTEPSKNLPVIVSDAIAGGVTIVQWRQKTALKTDYRRTYSSLIAVIQDTVPLVVNTMWDVASKLHVANLHLPEHSIPLKDARKEVGSRGLIGKSVHTVEAAIEAEKGGADYIIAGTIFESASHPEEKAAGLEFLSDVCRSVSIPVIAIGGITPANTAGCISAGASGIAVLSPIMQAKNPSAVAHEYRTALEEAWKTK